MNCPANFMAHLAAALPNHLMMEVVAVGRDVSMQVDQAMEDGWIVLGSSPNRSRCTPTESTWRFLILSSLVALPAVCSRRLFGCSKPTWTR